MALEMTLFFRELLDNLFLGEFSDDLFKAFFDELFLIFLNFQKRVFLALCVFGLKYDFFGEIGLKSQNFTFKKVSKILNIEDSIIDTSQYYEKF